MKSSFDRKDSLERFVRDNRPGFDTEEPDNTLWSKIEAKLPPAGQALPETRPLKPNKYRKQFSYDWRVAASILIVLTIGALTYVNRQYGLTRDPEMALQAPQYAREVTSYAQVINTKREELRKLTANKPELYNEFATELDRLEAAYQGLRSELPASPDPQTHLHAMVQNLQWQIELLNQQIEIIEKIKKANENEDSDSNLMSI